MPEFIKFVLTASVAVIFLGLFFKEIFLSLKSVRFYFQPKTLCNIENQHVDKFDNDGWVYTPTIRYTYSVNGTEYRSSKLAFGYLNFDTEEEAREIFHLLEDVPSVSFNPVNPNEAVLLTGLQYFHYRRFIPLFFLLIIGVISMVISVGILFEYLYSI